MIDSNNQYLSDEDLHRFSRQLILHNFEEEHQLALSKSHVAVIGAGGLGAPLLQYLVAVGIGKITVFDDDTVELSNLNRQIIHFTNDIGKSKVLSAAEKLQALYPSVHIEARQEKFQTCKIKLPKFTVICDASDNPKTRYAVNSYAHNNHTPLIFGGAVRLEGQLAVFKSGTDENAPCYQCLFPEAPKADLAPGCSEAGIIGSITGMIGSMMALEAIRQCFVQKNMTNPLGIGAENQLILFDGLNMSLDKILLTKNPNCPCCG